jgi:predicted ribosome quality control (RQC) complex YloA/Tae2 family protein
VDVTRIKYVKKIKGGGQGMVTYRNETTVIVTPQDDKSFEQA